MASADPRIKQIKVKTGVAKRTAKDVEVYRKEVAEQSNKIEIMRAEGKDAYDIKKQEEVLVETQALIPDCERRRDQAIADLRALLDAEVDLADTEEYKAAINVLESVRAAAP